MEKPIHWNQEKNELLKEERGVSFEEVVSAISRNDINDILDIIDHPNNEHYLNQRIYVVHLHE